MVAVLGDLDHDVVQVGEELCDPRHTRSALSVVSSQKVGGCVRVMADGLVERGGNKLGDCGLQPFLGPDKNNMSFPV